MSFSIHVAYKILELNTEVRIDNLFTIPILQYMIWYEFQDLPYHSSIFMCILIMTAYPLCCWPPWSSIQPFCILLFYIINHKNINKIQNKLKYSILSTVLMNGPNCLYYSISRTIILQIFPKNYILTSFLCGCHQL